MQGKVCPKKRDIYPNVAGIFKAGVSGALSRPIYAARVSAGFPSPADDYLEGRLDLNRHLIRHPIATYYVRVVGDSMIGESIYDGDLLVVDRAEEAGDGDIVVARIEGEFCVKRLHLNGRGVRLCSANPKFPDIEITAETDWEVWGRVIYSIRRH